jgi:hypothetical protein
MNTSPIIIANKALAFIGAGEISSLTEKSTAAKKFNLFWPTVWPAVCRAHPWKCISRQKTLSQAATAPLHTYDYAFVLPDDYLRMIEMDHPRRRWRRFGNTLQCDVSPAYIDYVYRCTDWSLYTEDLERCLYLNMAYELAYGLTQNAEIGAAVKKELEGFFLPLARMTDSVEVGWEESEAGTVTDMFTSRRNSDYDFYNASL